MPFCDANIFSSDFLKMTTDMPAGSSMVVGSDERKHLIQYCAENMLLMC
jgi:hypothetical protein